MLAYKSGEWLTPGINEPDLGWTSFLTVSLNVFFTHLELELTQCLRVLSYHNEVRILA